jgi:hypothetical protein
MSQFIIEAEIVRNDKIIKACIYDEPDIDLETVSKRLESYIVNEQLNLAGECMIRARKVEKPKTEEKAPD